MYDILQTLDEPAALRALPREALPKVVDELHRFILDSVSRTGGHLSSSLGTVELTVALHYVFNTPWDRIVWDVGHQTYAHKILTGRREAMSTLRQQEGISGFPRRCESVYDAFGAGHSSTSISAALGMALASQLQGQARYALAVIGDGAMTAGMAFEAMNHAGVCDDVPLIIVLNDNEMSISPPVGALNRYLARLLSGSLYAKTKQGVEKVLRFAPPILRFVQRMEEHAKGMFVPATLFEEFGLNYIGPIDGHDLDSLIPTLQNLKKLKGPQFLHIITKKGHGYKLAEADPILYHGPGRFNPAVGIEPAPASASTPSTYTQIFGAWLCDAAQRDARVVGITPAMREGSGMVEFEKRFPKRYYDVGIAEQHAITLAGGMAAEGMRPIVAIYSTFLQRGYDQLIHDIALQNLHVVFALDRAGLVGADGATHTGAYDLVYLRCIPNMVIMAASDEQECWQMLETALQHTGPVAVRYPRGKGPGRVPAFLQNNAHSKYDNNRLAEQAAALPILPIGIAELRRSSTQQEGAQGLAINGPRIVIFAFGAPLKASLEAAQALDASVVNMRFVKPLDEAMLHQMACSHDLVVTIEEGSIMGGAGSACTESLLAANIVRPVLQLGLPDHFIDHGDPVLQLAECGLDAAGIERRIREHFKDHFESRLG